MCIRDSFSTCLPLATTFTAPPPAWAVYSFSSSSPWIFCKMCIRDRFLDVHLMIEKPVRYIEDFVRAGADLISVHLEADGPRRCV